MLATVRTWLSHTVSVPAMALLMAAPAGAQSVDPTTDAELAQPAAAEDGEIVVTGLRASLETALVRKREAGQVVDSIVAEDIGKLPDNNIAEALQRIPGIQITRDHGEGSGVQIRGLTQTATLVNQRNAPGLTLEGTPTEILAGIDVYKNPSAALIEGGLGGIVNLRTRRPFDFKGSEVSVTGRLFYYDLTEEVTPAITALVSKRVDTSIGELGMLVSVAYLRTGGRQDQIGVEPFQNRFNITDFDNDGFFPGTNADPGDLVIVPAGGGGSVEAADRERIIVSAAGQWRPSDQFELLVEGLAARYDSKLSTETVFVNRGALLPAPGVPFTFGAGTNVAVAGAFRDISFSENSSINDRLTRFWQLSATGRFTPSDALTITGDIAYSEDRNHLTFGNVRLGNANPITNGPTLFFDTRTDLPTFRLSSSPTAIADYFFYNSRNGQELVNNTNVAARLDAEYRFDGFIRSVEIGGRFERTTVDRQRGERERISGRRPASVWSEAFQPWGFPDFFAGKGADALPFLPVVPTELTRDVARQCQVFSDAICNFTFAPINTYSQEQKTWAAYGVANFDFELAGISIEGNVGARYVNTDLTVDGFRLSPSLPPVALSQSNNYSNFLPSINLRAEVTDNLFLRAAAAKQLTRPALAQLAPNLTLQIQTATGLVGSAGNPELEPLRSTSYDLGLEYYFSGANYAYVAGFLKKVDGFIQTVTSTEPVSLPDFPGFTQAQITRPRNGDDGTIKGVEVGFQSFFDFLPSPFDGLGAQVNYTYVDSKSPGPIAGASVPLIGLSKNSINAIGFYEKGPWRLRAAYSWRDDYVETTSGPGSGALPIFVRPIGFLDASIGYQISPKLEVTIDGINLTQARFQSYFGEEIRRRFDNIYDRRFSISVRARM